MAKVIWMDEFRPSQRRNPSTDFDGT